MILVAAFVYMFYLYLLIGFVFAIWFTLSGVNTLDKGMEHASWGVRLLLIPGSILLWAVLWTKYINHK